MAAYLGETGVENGTAHGAFVGKYLVLEFFVHLGAVSRKRYAKPYHQLHAQTVDSVGECLEVGEFVPRGNPVAAFGVALAFVSLKLPAVVKDHRFEPRFRR